ncbi:MULTISPECIES: peptidoglycan DD-metalloendopeptidase family protein [unclassified Paraburkholderia]|uniref:peptidoglycan DD-metalloendopeptidase family protein n=1 Tax=unclassified Paraburkholderia TaxID=2615204 RepID=UPI0016225AAC|nr:MULTISPECIES: peptidoglycan DD-metalloendopeptidase family protein [unclassified Paraburkholderia]MBB5443426.1 murein DD-endopeptidase MepM/ murein hydrolase activator NlpD [Paraburkholderia sp. WSM4177]MBB5484353.1 murein DD-endopeptidase MepM/ murein hydrolase activator NlpD [Paraburkholderia sp. WSM4180]
MLETTRIKRLGCAALLALLAACGSAPVGPGYYRVERGDTLSKIARGNRQSVQNIARWNNLTNPDSIEVGQVLRVAPPTGAASTSGAIRSGGGGSSSGSASAAATPRPAPADTTPATAPAPISLVWPADGTVFRRFDGGNSKGIDISAPAGTPIVAAAPGTVVYAGNGLRGYGNLLILKHNADYLTAYAHNRALLVKEGESVKRGQKIAEMGDTDTDRVMLHFELRYQGRSIDPSKELPPR